MPIDLPEVPNVWSMLNREEPDVPSDIVGRVNYITDRWDVFCDAPFVVYLETLYPAALQFFWSYMGFDMLDVIRAYTRPKGLRRERHGRRSNRGRRRRGVGIPEWGDEIGKRLPGYQDLSRRQISDGVRHLWIFDNLLQAQLYRWMVVDLASEFAANWTSLLYTTTYCQRALDGRLLANGPEDVVQGVVGWTSVDVPFVEYAHNGVTWTQSTGNFYNLRWSLIWAGTAHNDDVEEPRTFYFGIRKALQEDVPSVIRTVGPIGPGQSEDFILRYNPPNNTLIQLMGASDFRNIHLRDMIVTGFAPHGSSAEPGES